MSAMIETKPRGLVEKVAGRFGVDAGKMLTTLKATAFRTQSEVTNEQMMALLVVADQYGLNPWTKEIYAFEDRNKGVVPVVGVDGWARIINENSNFDGMDFLEADDGAWVECTIYRKDRTRPIRVREWLSECKRNSPPWQSHPRRMLRHKSMIQCARLAFGFVGIYDTDEAERIIESTSSQTAKAAAVAKSKTEKAKALLAEPITLELASEPVGLEIIEPELSA
jgi:phage recombination protein Bet